MLSIYQYTAGELIKRLAKGVQRCGVEMLPTVMSTEKLPMSKSPAVSRVRRRSIVIYCGLILQNSIDGHLDVSYDEAGHINSIEAWYKYWPRMLLSWAIWSNVPNTAESTSGGKSDRLSDRVHIPVLEM